MKDFDLKNEGKNVLQHMKNDSIDSSLISVIIPIYNVDQYLRRCVDSVLEQSYTNMEIWLVDDGSTDRCRDICDEYERSDKRIRVIHKDNGGTSESRNTALDQIEGDYVTFVDADDFIHKYAMEVLVNKLKEHDADMCVCRMEYGKGERFTAYDAVVAENCKEYTGDTVFVTLFDDNTREIMGAACGKLYKKEILDGLRFPEGKIHEDEFLIHHILSRCYKVVVLQDKLYYHYKRHNSITRKNYSLKSLDAVEAMDDRCEFFENKGDTYLIFLCYRDYLRKIQYHYYSLKKYFPENEAELRRIREQYHTKYYAINKQMSSFDKLRYGLFIFFPTVNYEIKSLLGAKRV